LTNRFRGYTIGFVVSLPTSVRERIFMGTSEQKKTCNVEILSLKAIKPPNDADDSVVWIQRTNPDDGEIRLVIKTPGGNTVTDKPIPARKDCGGDEYQLERGTYDERYTVAVTLTSPSGNDHATAIFKRP